MRILCPLSLFVVIALFSGCSASREPTKPEGKDSPPEIIKPAEDKQAKAADPKKEIVDKSVVKPKSGDSKSKFIVPELDSEMIFDGSFDSGNIAEKPKSGRWKTEHYDKSTKVEQSIVKMPDGRQVLKVKFITGGTAIISYMPGPKGVNWTFDTPTSLYYSFNVLNNGSSGIWGQVHNKHNAPIVTTNKVMPGKAWTRSYAFGSFQPELHTYIPYARIYIKSAKAGDEFFIDDYSLQALSPERSKKMQDKIKEGIAWELIPDKRTKDFSTARKGNILMDSSFESNPGAVPISYGVKWWSAGGQLLSEIDAPHGKWAMSNKNKSGKLSRILSDPYLFRPDIPHSLSFYAKAPVGTRIQASVATSFYTPRRSGKQFDSINAVNHVFTGTGDWKRYHFSFIPKKHPRTNQNALLVRLKCSGRCLFDAVQLEEGGLGDYKPRELELFAIIKRRLENSGSTVFRNTEKIPLALTAQSQGPKVVEATIEVKDFWGRIVRSVPVKFDIKRSEIASILNLQLEPFDCGMYMVRLVSGGVSSRGVEFGVLAPGTEKGAEIMGGDHRTGLGVNAEFNKFIGTTSARSHQAYWAHFYGRKTTPIEDNWEFTEAEYAQRSQNPNLRIWTSFVKPPKKWKKALRAVAHQEKCPDGFTEAGTAYLKKAVAHWKGRVKYWECWNEPMGLFSASQYLEMLKAFAPAVKEMDPNAEIVGPSGFMSQWKFQKYLLDSGATELIDHWSYHGYMCGWPEEKIFGRYYPEYYKDILDAAKKAGRKIDIWNNEFGMPGTTWYDKFRVRAVSAPNIAYGVPFTVDEGVAIIAQAVTIGYAYGVKLFAPHCFDPYYSLQSQNSPNYFYSVFDYDKSIRPQALSYVVVCHKMNDAKLVKTNFAPPKFTDEILWFVFERPKGSFAVIFARQGKKCSVKLPVDSGFDFRNVFDGKLKDIQIKNGEATIKLQGQPIYIEYDGEAEKLLKKVSRISAE